MTITLELPPNVEAQLRENAARRDAEAMRRILAEAVAPTVEALLREPANDKDNRTDAEFEALADELAGMTPALPRLPDEAVNRAGIYADQRSFGTWRPAPPTVTGSA